MPGHVVPKIVPAETLTVGEAITVLKLQLTRNAKLGKNIADVFVQVAVDCVPGDKVAVGGRLMKILRK